MSVLKLQEYISPQALGSSRQRQGSARAQSAYRNEKANSSSRSLELDGRRLVDYEIYGVVFGIRKSTVGCKGYCTCSWSFQDHADRPSIVKASRALLVPYS